MISIEEKLTTKWYRDYSHKLHIQRLQEIKSHISKRIDNSAPKTKDVVPPQRTGKLFVRKEITSVIRKDNEKLLQILTEVSAGKRETVTRKILNSSNAVPNSKSLNITVRKKEAKRIDEDNEALVRRLNNKAAELSFKKFEEDWEIVSKYRNTITRKGARNGSSQLTSRLPPIEDIEVEREQAADHGSKTFNISSPSGGKRRTTLRTQEGRKRIFGGGRSEENGLLVLGKKCDREENTSGKEDYTEKKQVGKDLEEGDEKIKVEEEGEDIEDCEGNEDALEELGEIKDFKEDVNGKAYENTQENFEANLEISKISEKAEKNIEEFNKDSQENLEGVVEANLEISQGFEKTEKKIEDTQENHEKKIEEKDADLEISQHFEETEKHIEENSEKDKENELNLEIGQNLEETEKHIEENYEIIKSGEDNHEGKVNDKNSIEDSKEPVIDSPTEKSLEIEKPLILSSEALESEAPKDLI